MTTTAFRKVMLAAVVIALLVVAACGSAPAGPVTSALTEDQARAIAENALAGLNTGDYAAWSRDWDAAMKGAIQEADFLAYRDGVLADYGQYVSVESISLTPAKTAGNVRWEVLANFEKGSLLITFVFAMDGQQVVGINSAAAG
jgi:hypothetical protein